MIAMRTSRDEALAVPAEAIAFAAAWWAERLGAAPARELDPQPDRYSAEERERFRVALETAIGNHLRGEVPELHGHPQRAVRYSNHENVVYYDYDPDDTLCAAAEIAGITLGWRSMPGKTTMILEESEIRVSDGYAAPWLPVWTSSQSSVG